jgi:hypothetical protein
MTPDPEDTRYLLYVLRKGRLVQLSRTSKDGIGTAIVQHALDGEFMDGLLGVLDRPDDARPGTWIVNPFSAGHDRRL